MSLVVETGAQVPGANSYIAVADTTSDGSGGIYNAGDNIPGADSYFASHMQSALWSALTTPQKEGYLIQAARIINFGLVWKGWKASPLMFMQWPRVGVRYRGPWIVAFSSATPRPGFYPENTVPPEVCAAQCEQAALLLSAGDRIKDPDGSGLASVNLGNQAMMVTFDLKTIPKLVGRFIPMMLENFIQSARGKRGMVGASRGYEP